jgi:hypothetical protein
MLDSCVVFRPSELGIIKSVTVFDYPGEPKVYLLPVGGGSAIEPAVVRINTFSALRKCLSDSIGEMPAGRYYYYAHVYLPHDDFENLSGEYAKE